VSAIHFGDRKHLTHQARFDAAIGETSVYRVSNIPLFVHFALLRVNELNDYVSFWLCFVVGFHGNFDARNKVIPDRGYLPACGAIHAVKHSTLRSQSRDASKNCSDQRARSQKAAWVVWRSMSAVSIARSRSFTDFVKHFRFKLGMTRDSFSIPSKPYCGELFG
jgi:hypothetical protein